MTKSIYPPTPSEETRHFCILHGIDPLASPAVRRLIERSVLLENERDTYRLAFQNEAAAHGATAARTFPSPKTLLLLFTLTLLNIIALISNNI